MGGVSCAQALTGGGFSVLARVPWCLLPPFPDGGRGREIFGGNGPCHAKKVAELPHWYCAALFIAGLAQARFIQGLPLVGSHRARARLSANHACIGIIRLFVWTAGVFAWRHSWGLPRDQPDQDPTATQSNPRRDLIGPMAFILAVRVSEGDSDTHMPSGKMSRQRSRKLQTRF